MPLVADGVGNERSAELGYTLLKSLKCGCRCALPGVVNDHGEVSKPPPPPPLVPPRPLICWCMPLPKVSLGVLAGELEKMRDMRDGVYKLGVKCRPCICC